MVETKSHIVHVVEFVVVEGTHVVAEIQQCVFVLVEFAEFFTAETALLFRVRRCRRELCAFVDEVIQTCNTGNLEILKRLDVDAGRHASAFIGARALILVEQIVERAVGV